MPDKFGVPKIYIGHYIMASSGPFLNNAMALSR